MAATAFSLHRRRPTATFLRRRFSSTNSPPPPPPPPPQQQKPNPNPSQIQTSFSSYFDEVKASLTNNPPQNSAPPRGGGLGQRTTERASPDQIRKNLSEFRLRNTAAADNASPSKPFSFQEFYQRNAAEKERELANQGNKVGRIDIKSISENLRQFRSKNPQTNQDPFSLNKFRESLNLQPSNPKNPPFVMGSPQKHPQSVELKEKDDGAMKTRFVKMYSYKELGEKLRRLRPEGEGFSLLELNERLVKLREIEERETTAKIGSDLLTDLRRSLVVLNQTQEKKKTVQSLQTFDFMSNRQTPAYMEEPPKDHLVEKYFHLDNMSAAEKLKIELQKVRDEFKMSESDCGSARVQVAQLTTKIKHLTTALHKKDTHSRKGLQGMIQQRKKLLKYLRRTNWESYTLVLSKFGLRDNPDHKRLPTKEKKKLKKA